MSNIYFFLMDFSNETYQMVNVFNGPHIQSVAVITSYIYNPNESTTNHFSIPTTITSQLHIKCNSNHIQQHSELKINLKTPSLEIINNTS